MAITSEAKETLEHLIAGYFVPNESKQIASGVVELFNSLSAEKTTAINNADTNKTKQLGDNTRIAQIPVNCSQANGAIAAGGTTTITINSPKINSDSVCIAFVYGVENLIVSGVVFSSGSCSVTVKNTGTTDFSSIFKIALFIL